MVARTARPCIACHVVGSSLRGLVHAVVAALGNVPKTKTVIADLPASRFLM